MRKLTFFILSLLMTFSISAQIGAPNASSSHIEDEALPSSRGAELIGYWNFDEGTGLTVADVSGSGIDGTLTAEANWVDGISGKAVYFDTDGTLMKTDETLIFSNVSSSISMWVKWPEGMFDEWAAYVEYHRDFSTSWLGMFSRQDEEFMKIGSDGISAYANGFTPDHDKWYNFVGTTDENGVFKIYLNGELAGEESGDPRVVSTTPFILSIGGNNDGGEYPNAIIDEVKYYKGTLSADEIKAAYDEVTNTSAELVAHWDFNEGTGDIAADDSGNGFDGQIFEGTENSLDPWEWVDGVSGSAVHLTRDYMKIPADNAFALNSFTFSAWIKLNAELTEWGAVFTYAADNPDYIQFGFNSGTRQLYFYSNEDGRGLEFGAETPLELNEWYFVAVTADDNGVVSLYVNGELDGQSAGLKPMTDPELVIPGALGAGLYDGWEGNVIEDFDIDEASIYNGALSADEIMALSLEHSPDLVAHWNFDETAGSVAHDVSGNDIDLELVNVGDDAWTDGGVHFNGVDQYGIVSKEVTTQYFENPNFTIATWINVKEDIIVDDNARIAGMDNPFGINLKGADNNGRAKVYVWDGSSWTGDYITNKSFSDGTWHHFTVTHSTETGSTAFIDGVEAGTVDNPNIAFVQNAFFAIAASVSPEDTSTKWMCDAGYKDFRVYSKVLSNKEIANLAGITNPGVPAGLATYFIFDEFEAGDGNTINDASGNANNGVQHGPYTFKVDGVYGSAIEFNPEALDLDESSDPNNNCVVLPENEVYASQEFTVAAWINASNDTLVFNATWGEWGAIFAHDIGGAADYGLFYDPYGATMGVWTDGMGGVYLSGGEILVGDWNHVALTMNKADSMLILYVNGKEIDQMQIDQFLPETPVADTTCIGGSIERSKPFFGKIDEFRFYNYALSIDEISELATRRFMLSTEVSMAGETPLGVINFEPESEDGYYNENTEVNLTAEVTQDGFRFTGWTGDVESTENPLTFTINSDMHLKANFEKVQYALNVTIEGQGTVTPENGDYSGDIFLTATPAEGWKFDGWSGDATGTDNPLYIDITGVTNITATFIDVSGIINPEDNSVNLISYPNPFSGTATISYTLKQSSNINITVFDEFGRKVAILVNQNQTSGNYNVVFDGTNLESGIYYYQFRSNEQRITNKMMLSK